MGGFMVGLSIVTARPRSKCVPKPRPMVSLHDFLARWLRARPLMRASILTILLGAASLSAAASAHGRGLALGAWVLMGPIVFLQFLHCTTYVREALVWPGPARNFFAALVAMGTVMVMPVLMDSRLWIAVRWDDYWNMGEPARATT